MQDQKRFKHVTWQPPVTAQAEEKPDAFDASELEFIADVLEGVRGLTMGTDAFGRRFQDTQRLLGSYAARARAQAEAMIARDASQDRDLDAAVNAAGEDLSGRHGRAAVLRLAAGHFLVCGLLDDHEMEWTSVRRHDPHTIVTQSASGEELAAARARLADLAGVEA